MLSVSGCAYFRGPAMPATTRTTWDDYQSTGLLAPAGGDLTGQLPDSPTLQDCQIYAALNNPNLRASFHRWQAAVEAIHQADAMPDPVFSYGYYFQEVETRVGPQRQSFALAQKFPWFGKLMGRSDAAAAVTQAAWHRFQSAKWAVYARVTRAYVEYYYLGRAAAVTEDNVKLLAQLEEIVRTRYRAGAAEHPDLLRLQMELGKLRDQSVALGQMRAPLLAELNAALGRPSVSPAGYPEALEVQIATVTPDALLDRMRQHNHELAAAEREVSESQAQLALAEMEGVPDVTLGVTYVETGDAVGSSPSDSGQDAVVGMVSVNVPIWWDKLAAGVREARHEHQAAVHHQRDTALALAARLQMATFRLQDAQRRIELYQRTLIPKAREALRVTQKQFVGEQASFTDLIDTQRMLLEFELLYHRSLADWAVARAQIEHLIGGALDDDQTFPPADS